MRSNEQQCEYILDKYNNYKTKKQKQKKATTIITSLICFCLLFSGAIIGIKNYDVIKPDFSSNDTVYDSTESTNDDYKDTDKGVYIPPIELPETNEDMAMDMVAMVVKDGKIYTCWNMEYPYSLEYNEATAHLIGEYIGTGNGKINCYSKQSDYQGDFTSNTTYSFYTVNGYDDDFRIAAICEYSDGTYINFYDCLNGITLYNGEDLFGNKLHLADHYESITYQLHDDWNYAKGNYKAMTNITDTDVEQFLAALYSSPFVEIQNNNNGNNVYDLNQAHIYFRMKDGSTVGLRLFEGGLVKYAGSPAPVFVSMPGEIFDKIFISTTQ
ncbi:MAG: hypothetical protein IJO14_09845 [Clostridia bacterium]|nr:hypothetical protein [Clostridia bacterium]